MNIVTNRNLILKMDNHLIENNDNIILINDESLHIKNNYKNDKLFTKRIYFDLECVHLKIPNILNFLYILYILYILYGL